MSRRSTPGPDIDLDVEEVKDLRGDRITERRAQQSADQTQARAGRPSLTAPGHLR